ncbi:MAG: hypothetical protein HYX59_10300 [Elusimicrobia bacterium]|nr:hypothetical protein [Elusimicrobiota bacterium]
MIDLFGLGKKKDPQDDAAPDAAEAAPETASSEAAAPAPRGSHKLWAFLLVLDSAVVIVFAGVVAAKVYQHWQTPVLAPVPAPRKRPVKAAEAPVASTAPAPAPTPEPAKAPEPPKPAAAAKPAADSPRPPKPSMLAEAPKHRESPKPADAGGKSPAPKPAAAPAAPAAADGKVKALRTEFKLHSPKAKSVELVGAFIVRGGRKDMSREGDGTWTVTLYLNPGTYRYFFSVDKKKQLDPENPNSDKGASLLTIP